jgi:hypothetical protein
MARGRVEKESGEESKRSEPNVKVMQGGSNQIAMVYNNPIAIHFHADLNSAPSTIHGTVTVAVRTFADATNATHYTDTDVTAISRQKLAISSARF